MTETNRAYSFNIDFDGTVVTHDYPEVGKEIGATEVLLALAEKGHNLILFTMRCGKELQDAIDWFKERDIPLYGIQKNPSQHRWTTSPKSYANIMIDDSCLFAPLKYDEELSHRGFVDWEAVRQKLEERGIL